jgi:hypothetical protein
MRKFYDASDEKTAEVAADEVLTGDPPSSGVQLFRGSGVRP